MPEIQFNPEMLVLARRSREWTQGELAANTGTTQGRLSKIEHGLLEPTEDLVGAFAKELRYPREFFYQRALMRGLPYWFYRRRKLVAQKTLDRIHAEIALKMIHLQRLVQSADIGDSSIPQFDIDDYSGSVADIARAARKYLQIEAGPIRNLVELIENAGCVVVPCDFGITQVDAIGVREPGLPPVMFVNTMAPTDRMRWTVAHELGHLVMHDLPTDQMEQQADEFAAEFLMPEADIRPHLYRVDLAALGILKRVWRVSMQALLFRAKQLKTISQATYVKVMKQISALGFRRREPAEFDLSPEQPRLFHQILDFHKTALKLDDSDVLRILTIYADDFRRLYSPGSGHLRLVG